MKLAPMKMAGHYQLDEQKSFIVLTAAWFHDIGHYLGDGSEHELKGAAAAEIFLKEYGKEPDTIIEVNKCIMATQMPQRLDERRFDVEGAYNIRYQIIKKRIDKVHLRNTNERLTQPGKIAIVYFNEKDITTYIKEITRLQQQHSLMKDLEMLHPEFTGCCRTKSFEDRCMFGIMYNLVFLA